MDFGGGYVFVFDKLVDQDLCLRHCLGETDDGMHEVRRAGRASEDLHKVVRVRIKLWLSLEQVRWFFGGHRPLRIHGGD